MGCDEVSREEVVKDLSNCIAEVCPDLLEDSCDDTSCITCLATNLYFLGWRRVHQYAVGDKIRFWISDGTEMVKRDGVITEVYDREIPPDQYVVRTKLFIDEEEFLINKYEIISVLD